MLTNFTETGLLEMISNQVEENLHLDYKGASSLVTPKDKKEIAKDISAFANSDGGQIIYGILEYSDRSLSHLPEKLDPIDRASITKESLEQVINSNIQPKISGLTIHPISLSSSANDVAYVVNIPKSNTAHQAADKRYYKRYNFQSIAMEDYEIKDIINRLSSPDLNLILDSDQITLNSNVLKFPIVLRNNSKRLAKDVKLTIEFFHFQNYNIQLFDQFSDESYVNAGRKMFSTHNEIGIYYGLNAHIDFFQLVLNENISSVIIKSTIYCDNMSPVIDVIEIIIEMGVPRYITH
ncbi:MAG: ATP-binding protein [Bacteroidia bacterium]